MRIYAFFANRSSLISRRNLHSIAPQYSTGTTSDGHDQMTSLWLGFVFGQVNNSRIDIEHRSAARKLGRWLVPVRVATDDESVFGLPQTLFFKGS